MTAYFTGSVGSDYDSVPYDAIPDVRTDMRRIAALSALYGGNIRPRDVLDLGCGFGRGLALAAPLVEGRLVGVDASRVACEAARAKLAAFGDRATIVESEFGQLDFEALGSFDVILCIGTLYAVPKPEQEALLARIGAMLRPGGVAVISYYAGLVGYFRHGVLQLVRDSIRGHDDPRAAIAEGRAWLQQFREVLGQSDPALALWSEALTIDDAVMAHEMLGHGAAPLRHMDTNRVLAAHGAGFASMLPIDRHGPLPTAELRAVKADVEDLANGGYHYVVFVRPENGSQAFNIRASGVIWRSLVARIDGRPDGYRRMDGVEYSVDRPRIRALVDEVGTSSPDWAGLSAAMVMRDPQGDPATLEAEVVALWRAGLIEPCPAHMAAVGVA